MVNETGNMVEKFPLSTEWVEENYTKEIVNAIKNKAIKLANGRFLSVPVGDVIDQDVIDNMVFDPNAPEIFYKQGVKDRCAFCSFASALDLLGFKKEAAALIDYMENFYKTDYDADFSRIMQHIVLYMEMEKKPLNFFYQDIIKEK